MKVELDLSNYETKTDLKNSSSFTKMIDLANLKSDVDKSNIDKLKSVPSGLSTFKNKVDKLYVDKVVPVPVDLSKLSDAVKTDVVKKDIYNVKINNIEDKIPDITNLATNASLKTKINEVKGKMPSIINLASTAALTTVSNLVKKPDYNTKVNEVQKKITDHVYSNKYITTPEFSKFTAENFAATLKKANLASKSDIANFVKRYILMIN